MAVSHRGAISFGLVHIPIGLYTATQDNDIHFNQLHKEDNGRIRYKKVCAHCGEEVQSSDITKGFEYEKDKYIVMNDDDFEKAKTEKDKTIQILHFADLNTIRPVYYDKAYHTIPEAGGDKAFELLRQAMLQENKVAIAKTVLGTKEKLLTIMPTSTGVLTVTMYYHDEIKEMPKEPSQPQLQDEELNMAKTLIGSMTKDFDAALYKDEYQSRLREIIEQKINGEEFVAVEPENKGNIINLMDALKASIQEAEDKQTRGA